MPIHVDTTGTEKRYLHDMLDVSHGRTLEIGCGDGRMTWQYADLAARVIGIDVSLDDLRTASGNCPPKLRDKISLLAGSAIRLPFAKQCFDHVLFAWSF